MKMFRWLLLLVLLGSSMGCLSQPVFAEANLTPLAETPLRTTGKRGVHSEHMGFLLAEMQSLPRAFPGATW